MSVDVGLACLIELKAGERGGHGERRGVRISLYSCRNKVQATFQDSHRPARVPARLEHHSRIPKPSPSNCRLPSSAVSSAASLHSVHHGRRQGLWHHAGTLDAVRLSGLIVLCTQNKRLSKGKKGIKKKVVDPFSRKGEFYYIRPCLFGVEAMRSQTGTTSRRLQSLRSKTSARHSRTGLRVSVRRLSHLAANLRLIGHTGNANDSLKGRIVEVSLADLNKDEEQSFRKIKLRVDEIQGKNCLTNFHGMSFTSDKLRSLVRKWQTLIEAHVDVKTTDGYLLRLFAIGFTKRRPSQVRKTTYAQSSQIREIRKKMFEIMTREATTCDLKELVQKFVPEAIGREIEKAARGIYPLQNVYVRKAKILKAPKFDMSKLLELHGESTDVSPVLSSCPCIRV